MISITLHGVQGSTPSVNSDNLSYGGNTCCLEIQTDNKQIVIDAGTGFGSVDLKKEHKDTYLLFSHLHHDHIQGLLFNQQLFTANQAVCCKWFDGASELKQHIETYFHPVFHLMYLLT